MMTYWAMDAQVHVFLISALVGNERSASRPGRFTPGGKEPRYRYPLDSTLGGP
jgi:hypothetical protein